MNIAVCCPSYKRPKVQTLDYLPFAKVYVCETEYEAYATANPGAVIIPCKEGIQGNLCRIRNHILDTEFAQGTDVVCLLDDDYTGVFYYESNPVTGFGYEEHPVPADEFLEFIERYTNLCREYGYWMWGVNINFDPMCYDHFKPFNTVAYIGGPFSCHMAGTECRYDEALPLKEDYDMTLQHLHRYHGALRVNKYHYRCQQSKQAGGCATYRNMDRERQQFEALQQKWGSKIVQRDKKSKHDFDYNPIIKTPIPGV